ncbi:MAG: hypothetical protein DYG92_07420 [Leptolyngbya sp. PLA1]|nr:hypothetical protein [Leptolyngbya sp. PLA1]
MVIPLRLPSEHPDLGLSVIAETGGRLAGFAPYVPAIDDEGTVTFQAELRRGGSGIFAGQAAEPEALVEPGGGLISRVCSHPDRARDGSVCFYGEDRTGAPGVFLHRAGAVVRLAERPGTLGPTINARGAAAFRAMSPDGHEAVYTCEDGEIACVASVGERHAGFRGLPVAHDRGTVLVRGWLRSGAESIALAGRSDSTTIAETGAHFESLGNFPSINARGVVAFTAAHRELGEAAFVSSGGRTAPVAVAGDAFASVRGVLINDSGPVALLATPRGGCLGVYLIEPLGPRLLLQVGSTLAGARVAEFALNPVSVNNRGQLALRLGLEDGRGLIVRTDAAT